MKTEVISNTVQKFNGVSYYLCGAYFQKKGVRLHRVVWEYHNGAIPNGIEAASKWHGSEEGKEWHSKQGIENYKKRELITYRCTYCGKEFQTKHIYSEHSNHFCHNNCKAAYRRMLVRNGVLEK